MRLDFNLLWVENQQDLVQSQREKLERDVRAQGFRLQVKFMETVEAAIECLADDVYSDHVDLILMDYDLGPGKKGDEGLIEVRALIPYRDVVFYSSQAGDLNAMVLKHGVQGVFCSTRNELPDTAFGVFESLVKKVVDIDHSRGIVMGTTSDIDHYVMDALADAFDGCAEEKQQETLDQIKKDVEKIRGKFEAAVTAILAAKHPSELFEQHAIYTSIDRLQLLRKVLRSKAQTGDWDKKLLAYIEGAIPKRNMLAHVRVEVNGFIRKLVNRKGEEHTSAHMKRLRLDLLQHHEEFEKLSQLLKTRRE
ncbi:hypothetical protein FXN63_00025 [Pigmentiphaga aceris]|uniref:Uncharacterized protein n=1 Tax=Pigmentiphaga aceris TaxID=1940612 RepID=A0A5C0AT07_9BURK|nr:hypothetical protein [Pigmentiphaga aceris]QEI04403.1 hypothetical protein FXN63_00025 [Pigmentiphaga aceris]